MNLLSKQKLFFLFVLLACYINSYSQDYLDDLKLEGRSESYVVLRNDRKDFGFGLIDSKSNLKWQLPVPGIPIGMGRSGDNAIVIYAEEFGNFSPIKVLHALLVETDKKKVAKDVVIYTNPGQFIVQVKVLRSPDGELSSVLVRETKSKNSTLGFGIGSGGSIKESKAITMIHLGSNLALETKELKSIAIESEYLTTSMGSNNELYVCSYANDQLTTEKFDGNGNKLAQLATEINFYKKVPYNFIVQYDDSLRKNCFTVGLKYLDDQKVTMARIFRFDFNDKKIIVTEPFEINKDYVKKLKDDNPGSKVNHLRDIYALKPLQIINTADKTIFIKELQSEIMDRTTKYIREGAIISIYSKELKLIKDIPINKYSANFFMGFAAICGHVKDDNLYAITNEMDGLGYQCLLYKINLNDFSITNKRIPAPESGMNWITEPGNIIWDDTNFRIPFLNAKASFKLKLKTEWVVEKY